MSAKQELTELDHAIYGNQEAEFELHTMRLQIAELQAALALVDELRSEIAELQSDCDIAIAAQHRMAFQIDEKDREIAKQQAEHSRLQASHAGLESSVLHLSALVDDLRADLAHAQSCSVNIVAAAKAVIDRWDSPKWKVAEPTGHVISRLRDAIAQCQPQPLPGAQSLWQNHSVKPRDLTADELAIVEEGKKYERLAGRGMHELRFDELPGYLMWVADNYADGPHMEGHYGAVRLSLLRALSWVVAELERKTNDERVVASQLANVRAQKPGGEQL